MTQVVVRSKKKQKLHIRRTPEQRKTREIWRGKRAEPEGPGPLAGRGARPPPTNKIPKIFQDFLFRKMPPPRKNHEKTTEIP